MKKKILVLSGALTMVIAAGAIFFSAKTNSVDHAIFLDNIEALASGEPGGGSGIAVNYTCYETLDDVTIPLSITYECKSGTSLADPNKDLKVPFHSYTCNPIYNRRALEGSKWGICYIK